MTYVVQGDMDTGLEGLVNGTHTVCREEHRDQGIPLHVLLGPLRKEDIGLVQQQHAVPQVRQTEHVLE